MSLCVMCQNGLPSSCLGGTCSPAITPSVSNEDESSLQADTSTKGESYDDFSDEGLRSSVSTSRGKRFRQGSRSLSNRNTMAANRGANESSGRGDTGARSNVSRRGRDANLKDQQSTGRKRAAKLYPLDKEGRCEWNGSANCGGGNYPILGCLSGTQQARHHGPDKNVVNNEEGNVHRICDYCHNRWHALNDVGYDWNRTNYPPHNPRPLTDAEKQEVALDELRYRGSKRTKERITD